MADNIQPIETIYNGYRFRSRLEARWAVFFDALGITYEYEPEGFTVDGECYLPDFYLPGFDIYAEVKPDTVEGRFDVDNRYPKFITWGGKIRALLILSDLPGSRFYEDALLGNWCFPIIYYHGFGYRQGWWTFYLDYYSYADDKSLAYNVNGCLMLPTFPNMGNTIKAQSSTYLLYRKEEKENDKAYMNKIRERLEKKGDFGPEESEILEALSIARQARFEHGETPKPESVSIWRRNGYKKPENWNCG